MRPLEFEGSGAEYFKIWIVNVLLLICTMGLYYPWAKVRKQRYLYANSTFDGRNFEYHATGKQLFFGYLIAMTCFIIFLILQNISPLSGSIVLLLFFLATPWIIWRSLQFSTRMTSFSNVRLAFNGSLGPAYLNFLLLPFVLLLIVYVIPASAAVTLTMMDDISAAMIGVIVAVLALVVSILGIYFYAYLRKRNTSYVINGYRYGQGVFSVDLETKQYLKIILKTFGLAILSMIAVFAILAAVGAAVGVEDEFSAIQESMQESAKESIEDPDAAPPGPHPISGSFAILIGLVYFFIILVSLIVSAYSLTRQRTYSFANAKLDQNVSFVSTLKARSLAFVMVTNLFAIVLTLGLATPWATVRVLRLMLNNTLIDTDVDIDRYISQQQSEQSSLGEQIGDAFDVDIGIGL